MTTKSQELDIESGPLPNINEHEKKPIETTDRTASDNVPYTIFTLNEKRFMVFILAFAALFSPIASTIYYPALAPIASDLHVSQAKVNLSITTFMILQGIAPAFVGAFSDAEGRRPAYLFCFVVFIAADIGLALQSNYAALLVLRCVQSAGSSGTVALANAVVADFSTPHERGKWMAYANAGALLGPTIGPIIGGLLAQYLGWRSIFWFLAIFAGVYLLPIVLFFPESSRAVVGNGSQRPPKWNSCLWDPVLKKRIAADPSVLCPPIPAHSLRFPNPLKTLALLFEKEASLIFFSSGLLFAGFYGLMAGLPSQLERNYGFNALHVGLCFIPSGVGGSIAAFVCGRLIDLNFRRHARKLNLDASNTRAIRTLTAFPIEAARLEIAFPFILGGSATILAFGWVMHFPHLNLSGPLILLFCLGFCCTGAFMVLSTLFVDLFPKQPGTATAAGNLTRCLLGGGATASVVPMINRIGSGWTFTFVAALWLILVPALGAVVKWGPGMRRAKEEREKEKAETARANVG